ncbi:MAG: type II toxin-antitoxin system HicB family antitoxin [Actinobacteria bacterium]|nr:type II toxin-antitoxin system HicB family antitoxin [Actinomycetota bacterium]
MKYMVVIEKGETGYGAHVPDLPGVIAAGETREEVLKLVKEAIEFHIEGLHEAGDPVPPPSSSGELLK